MAWRIRDNKGNSSSKVALSFVDVICCVRKWNLCTSCSRQWETKSSQTSKRVRLLVAWYIETNKISRNIWDAGHLIYKVRVIRLEWIFISKANFFISIGSYALLDSISRLGKKSFTENFSLFWARKIAEDCLFTTQNKSEVEFHCLGISGLLFFSPWADTPYVPSRWCSWFV